MKISKQYLKNIILEELKAVLESKEKQFKPGESIAKYEIDSGERTSLPMFKQLIDNNEGISSYQLIKTDDSNESKYMVTIPSGEEKAFLILIGELQRNFRDVTATPIALNTPSDKVKSPLSK